MKTQRFIRDPVTPTESLRAQTSPQLVLGTGTQLSTSVEHPLSIPGMEQAGFQTQFSTASTSTSTSKPQIISGFIPSAPRVCPCPEWFPCNTNQEKSELLTPKRAHPSCLQWHSGASISLWRLQRKQRSTAGLEVHLRGDWNRRSSKAKEGRSEAAPKCHFSPGQVCVGAGGERRQGHHLAAVKTGTKRIFGTFPEAKPYTALTPLQKPRMET